MTVTSVVALTALSVALLALLVESWRHTGDHVGDPTTSRRFVVQRLARWPRLARLLHRRLDPQTAGGLVVTMAFAILAVTAIAFGVLLDWVDSNEGLAELDGRVARWGSSHATDATTDALTTITQLGSTAVIAGILLVAAAWDFFQHKNRHVFSFVALVGAGQLLLVTILKLIVSRDRPDILQLVEVSSASFPSGHSAAAAASWAGAAFIVTRRMRVNVRAAVAAFSVAIAAAVATSRVLLGVHWVTDVVAGLTLGWGWTLSLIVLFSRQLRPIAPFLDRASAEADAGEGNPVQGADS